jgi:predicted transcriptional regulator
MKLSEVCDILNATVLLGDDLLDHSVSGGGGADLMEDVLAAVAKNAVLMTGLTTEEVIKTCQLAGVAAVVFVRGKKPDARVVQQAEDHKLAILLTDYSLFVACGRLYMKGLKGLDGSW